MSRKQLVASLTFAVSSSAAALVGPRLGDWITQDGSLPWQLLPWGLLAACWVGLVLWMRRARPSA